MKPRISVAQVLTLSALVYGVWLLLSGHYTGFLLTVGLASTALAVFFAMRMQLIDEEGVPLANLNGRIWTYLPWLVLEIVRSNMAVARIILRRDMRISPTIIRFRARPRTDLGRFILANSITLTPGTVTTDIKGDELEVYGLVTGFVEGLAGGEMDRRVAALERASAE